MLGALKGGKALNFCAMRGVIMVVVGEVMLALMGRVVSLRIAVAFGYGWGGGRYGFFIFVKKMLAFVKLGVDALALWFWGRGQIGV